MSLRTGKQNFWTNGNNTNSICFYGSCGTQNINSETKLLAEADKDTQNDTPEKQNIDKQPREHRKNNKNLQQYRDIEKQLQDTGQKQVSNSDPEAR